MSQSLLIGNIQESSEVKIIKQEEVIKKSESKFQTLEKEIFKLKTILEAEKNKNIDVPVPLQNTQVSKDFLAPMTRLNLIM